MAPEEVQEAIHYGGLLATDRLWERDNHCIQLYTQQQAHQVLLAISNLVGT